MRRPGIEYLMRVQLSTVRKKLALGVSIVAVCSTGFQSLTPAYSQSVETGLLGKVKNDPNAQMLLQADQLIYDNDAEKVTAEGSVQIDYNGYKLVAQSVSYNQKTKRIVANGNVEILEPSGNRIVADTIDITDDFGSGFLNALRVDTADDTRFAAESAERFDGEKTVFNHGVYTACKACKENPDKPPLWQIKAKTVVLNSKTKTVTYRHARFELFGLPIAYLPYFSHADPSTKRKSGFLLPEYGYDEKLGYSLRVPYFWATGASHDLTIGETWYSKQGFLTDLEWRHQLDNGYYTFKAAGISQQKMSEFTTLPDNLEKERGMIATTGRFNINPRWSIGWNAMIQSDRTFSRSYNIQGFSSQFVTNEVYLRGLAGRNYFDLSAYQFLVQDTPTAFQQQDEQARVHPVLDYNYVKSEPVYGGQLSYNANLTSISRTDPSTITPTSGDTRFHGIDGTSTRGSLDVEWKRRFTTTNGMNFTPSLSFEGSATFIQPDGKSAAPVTNNNSYRAVPSFGLEYRWPFLATVNGNSHILEPIAQVFVRPDVGSVAALPNEDAQSLVFDTTTLFRRSKFSGYDRLEGGVRANVGLRYSALFSNGVSASALVGQSFHLAGRNPYARQDDVVNTGQESGLETDASDIVAMAGIKFNSRFALEARGRFDTANLSPARLEASGRFSADWLSLSAGYAFIGAQPDYGFDVKREQANISGSVKLTDYWKAFGAAQFDVHNNQLISNSFGISYNDECFSLSLGFSETRDRYTSDVSGQRILLKIGIRTIGSVDHSQSLNEFTSF